MLTGYKKFMTDEEITLLLDYASKQTVMIRLIFLILIFMGLRVGEVCRLERRNIQGNRLIFQLEKSGRMHERVIPKFLLASLEAYIQRYDIQSGWLFPTKLSFRYNGRHDHIVRTSIGCHISRFRKTYGQKYPSLLDSYCVKNDGQKLYRVSCHTIRHWFLVKAYQQSGSDVLLVADTIGHVKMETTFGYLRAWKRMQREQAIADAIEIEVSSDYAKSIQH